MKTREEFLSYLDSSLLPARMPLEARRKTALRRILLLLVAAVAGTLAAPAAAQAPYVLSGEQEVFSFTSTGGKQMAICIGAGNSAIRYLVYRYGKKNEVELEYPAVREGSFKQFTYWYYLRPGGPENDGLDLNYLEFKNNGVGYTVYEEWSSGSDTVSAGIRIKVPGKMKEVDIKARPGTVKGGLMTFRRDTDIGRKADE